MSPDSTKPIAEGIAPIVDRLRQGSLDSRRSFLKKSAAAGAGALTLSVASANTSLAHEAGDDDVSDVDVLNFALTLEHLENAFYRLGREEFDRRDFMSADTLRGFGARVPKAVPGNLEDIGAHEAVRIE